MPTTSDFLVIGGGIIGLNIARALKTRFRDATVTVLEKEESCGRHASGRNSGVLHAGFYYTRDSLKAKFTRVGNRQLSEYCETKSIPVSRCGKLVVARDARDHVHLDELLKRGRDNGIDLQELTEGEAKRIEPRVKTHERAIFSPSTSSVNPRDVVEAMVVDAGREGVAIHCGVQYLTKRGESVRTSSGIYQAGYIVNAGGLQADKIARQFGCSKRYRILPFKGLYLYSDEPAGSIRTNVYPVPDLRNPFLGVHFTVTADGRAKIGPTAIPTLWREQYRGTERFSLSEFLEILVRSLGLLAASRFAFLKLALSELHKYSRTRLVSLAATLLNGVNPDQYRTWAEAGIRAQLVDVTKKRLEMDFVVEEAERSIHVLNAVSPGFTCAIPFAEYVGDRIVASVA